ncbi:DUF3455 domain-containing protein [Micromonospora chokoriensis]
MRTAVPGTIPELLLTVDSRSGRGVLAGVTYISRLQISGGVASAAAREGGATNAVPYGAIYAFSAAKRG